MNHDISAPAWQAIAILVGRLVFAGLFIMAVGFKFADMGGTATYIAGAGFPFPLLLAWLAAIFETLLIIGFLTGAFFAETALLAAVYVVFLAFAFHGPSHWEGNQAEFGFFVDHFSFMAGLLFAAAHGRAACWRCGKLSSADAPRRPPFAISMRYLGTPSIHCNRLQQKTRDIT